MKITTKNGYDFFAVSSMLQKSLRRGDVVLASKACVELLPKYANYCWNRLLIVSAEDCNDVVTSEVMALYHAWRKCITSSSSKKEGYGRIFFAKSIVLLAKCRHSRDADELLLLIANRIPAEVFEAAMNEVEEVFEVNAADFEVPHWVYDKHTREGRRAGKSHEDFIREEHDALSNASTMFRNFDEMVETWGYCDPDIDLGVQKQQRKGKR